jgi:anti-anti-sigma regulatory factor
MGSIQVKDDVISVAGAATADVASELRSALTRPPAGGFIVDLSAATRIDASIVQVLIAAKRSAVPFRIVALSSTERERWEQLGIAAHLLSS